MKNEIAPALSWLNMNTLILMWENDQELIWTQKRPMSFNFEEKRGDYWEERHSFIHRPMYSFFSWGSLVPNAQLDWPGTKSHLKGKSDLVKFGDFNLSPLVNACVRLFSKSFSFQKSAIFLSNQALWPKPRSTWHQCVLSLLKNQIKSTNIYQSHFHVWMFIYFW